VFITQILESELTNHVDHLGYEEEPANGEKYQVKVSQVTMAYNNSEVIKRLTERGELIKTEKWAKLQDLNNTILKEI
jgi:hypothetical protein